MKYFLILLMCGSAFGQSFMMSGKVTAVKDGRTVIIENDKNIKFVLQIRLLEIPDESHPLYDTITDHLKAIVKDRTVYFTPQINNGKWMIGKLVVNNVDVTGQMLRDGAGWYTKDGQSKPLPDDDKNFADNEHMAMNEKRGIWAFDIKRPSEIAQEVKTATDLFGNSAIARSMWRSLGPSVEGLFGYETKAIENNSCGGKVVGVVDGDTVKILGAGNRLMTIRLAGIDAPEKAQDFGAEAKKHLSDLVFGKTVQCQSDKTDRYGRMIGKLILDGQDINLAMVSGCLAWHYKEYESEQSAQDRELYASAEVTARKNSCGIWQDVNPLKPSEFRRERFVSTFIHKADPKGLLVAPGVVGDRPRPYDLLQGPQGGCYFYNQSGNKRYVERELCN